ncbi:MAG: diguanylate cyclase, partial [Gordonia polyisoprenivorans]|nr:diguanylate cyclase [Gordonia polyisoprenivorans]
RADARSADYRYPAARSQFGPSLGLTAAYNFNRARSELLPGTWVGAQGFTSTAGAVLNQPLLTFGRNSAAAAGALAESQFARDSLRVAEADVLLAVVGAYVAHFVRFRVVIAHLVFSSTAIVALAARAVYDGHPIGMVLYFALVSLVASNGIVLLLSAYSTAFKSTMQTQLDWANTDALTGVLNRRGFSVAADSIVAATPPVAVIMLDVDRFKQINDAYGHSVGDAILSRLAARVQELAGPDAVVGRLGGDEFAVALRSSPQAVRILIHAIQQTPLDVLSGSPVTVSIGAAIYREGPTLSDEYRDLLEQATALADEALLMAKNAGRNTHTIIDHDHVAERTQEQRIAPIDSLRSRRRRLIHSPNTHGPGRHS